jgi:hypothetical protein
MTRIQELKKNRTVVGGFDKVEEVELTVVMSFYNGSQYVRDRLSELTRQNLKKYRLLIIDNGSSDHTWEEILKYSPVFTNFVAIRNPVNFGGTGSAWFNQDFIETEWFTSIHQDDSYASNHLEALVHQMAAESDDVVAISNDMGREETNRRFTSHPPRGIWFQKENDPVTAFLANMRKHQIPWGATAFRTEMYWKCLGNWHSPTFPDTEIILKMCAYGIFVNTGQETMYYTENPSSESHDLESKEQELGVALSILRVIQSREFKAIVQDIPKRELESFQVSFIQNLEFRCGKSSYLNLLINSFNDQLLNLTEYSEPSILRISADHAHRSELAKSGHILANLLGVLPNPVLANHDTTLSRKNWSLQHFVGYLPYRFRKRAFKILVETQLRVLKKSNWNFRWKK